VKKLRGAIVDGEKEKTALRRARDTAADDMRTSQARSEELSAEMDEVVGQLRNVGDDRRRNKQEERMNEAIDTMKRIFTGVHGKLGDLCRPIQKKYAQAIEVTAGKQMDAIVVDSKQVAAECIRYLKDQRVGTCILLPLNNITSQPIPDRLRTIAGSKYRPCVDLVECDDRFKPAVAYALGATLVCDTLEEAQDLCFTRGEKVKVVTLKGHVIGKSGAMTGGTISKSGGLADRWEEKDVERLRRRKVELEESIAKNKYNAPTRQQQVDLETRFKTLQTRIQFSEADCKVTDEKLGQLQQQKDIKEASHRALVAEIDAVKREIGEMENRLRVVQQQTRQVEAEVFSGFSASVGVTNIREYEDNKLKKHQTLVQKRASVGERKASLAAQLEYETKRDFQGALSRVKGQGTEAKIEISALEDTESELVSSEAKLRKEVEKMTAKLNAIKEDRNGISSRFKSVQNQRAAVVAERDVVAKKISGEEILIEKARSHLHDVLQKAQVDEITLPTIDGGDDTSEKGSEDLRWSGNQSVASSSSGSRGGGRGRQRPSTVGNGEREGSDDTSTKGGASAHFSQGDNAVVIR
jgi:structural maintenance of chromosome 1